MDLLARGELAKFGQLWWDSHESSRVNFENSTPALDKIVEISHTLPGALGARLSGGGFGGISIHLVQDQNLSDYQSAIRELYAQYSGSVPETIICHPGAGAC